METVGLVVKLVFSLAAVLGLLWVAAKVMSRGLLGGGTNTATLTVVARQPLTRTASVALVRVGERAVLLGVTDQQVSVLSEQDADELMDVLESTATQSSTALHPGLVHKQSGSFGSNLMEQLRARTARR